jgi:hypothetical protein
VAPVAGAAAAIPTWRFLNSKKETNENSPVQ